MTLYFVEAHTGGSSYGQEVPGRHECVYGANETGRVYRTIDAAERAAEKCRKNYDGCSGKIGYRVCSCAWYGDLPDWATEIIEADGQGIAVYSVAPIVRLDGKIKVAGDYVPAESLMYARYPNGIIRRAKPDGKFEYQYWGNDHWYPTEAEALD